MTFDNTNPIAYGMPSSGLALYLNSPAFEITAQDAENYDVVVRYADRELLQSGWLVGEENLARRAAVVSAKLGEGKVVLIGFPAQHRAQTARHVQAAVQRAAAVGGIIRWLKGPGPKFSPA